MPKRTDLRSILILGSDRRWSDLKKNNPALSQSNPARSDTILLVRMDPHQQATAVLSIPCDLKVLIPGYGINKKNPCVPPLWSQVSRGSVPAINAIV